MTKTSSELGVDVCVAGITSSKNFLPHGLITQPLASRLHRRIDVVEQTITHHQHGSTNRCRRLEERIEVLERRTLPLNTKLAGMDHARDNFRKELDHEFDQPTALQHEFRDLGDHKQQPVTATDTEDIGIDSSSKSSGEPPYLRRMGLGAGETCVGQRTC